MIILVQRSRRPRRWAGVALLALLALLWWQERHDTTTPATSAGPPPAESAAAAEPPDSPSLLGTPDTAEHRSAPAPYNAQLTDLAPSRSTSTAGAMPTR